MVCVLEGKDFFIPQKIENISEINNLIEAMTKYD